MTQIASLHPLDPALVASYVRSLVTADAVTLPTTEPGWSETTLSAARAGYQRALDRGEDGANAVTVGLARVLATAHPSFVGPGVALTTWEARLDRGLGMLLRPPSRLFLDAGLDPAAARCMPIRLDPWARGGDGMGGAYVPAHLMPEWQAMLTDRRALLLRRLDEHELDAVAVLGLVMDAVAYATERHLGMFEAMQVISLATPAADPPGAVIHLASRKRLDPILRRQLEEAMRPPKAPGPLARLFRRAP